MHTDNSAVIVYHYLATGTLVWVFEEACHLVALTCRHASALLVTAANELLQQGIDQCMQHSHSQVFFWFILLQLQLSC